eukprot:CAMPEP_0202734594 /NCGR_PEP_ID=MMETSP1385-20130828/188765_1 /ASSEMBLY_ACC=CAM_ASM_000861 /TAXON_ID=933848 /ORGANISM="Elphidium margaritaceum" /LENGTH=199 /DNA_ID=CAMNT_0049400965 /DNA_START=235 /DNA_END=831 /DNA_ORIENTATION=-
MDNVVALSETTNTRSTTSSTTTTTTTTTTLPPSAMRMVDLPSASPVVSHPSSAPRTNYVDTIEVVAICVIILLIVSLFVYHCRKVSKIESKLNQTSNNKHSADSEHDEGYKRKRLKRRHSFSRSASFASNLESVREEPEIFDTRLADERNQDERVCRLQREISSPMIEPWYKWLQHDSPRQMAAHNKSEKCNNKANQSE